MLKAEPTLLPRYLSVVSVATLRTRTVYRTPLGRPCVLVAHAGGRTKGGKFTFRYFTFRYLDEAPGARRNAAAEEFVLSQANLHLLREVVR